MLKNSQDIFERKMFQEQLKCKLIYVSEFQKRLNLFEGRV